MSNEQESSSLDQEGSVLPPSRTAEMTCPICRERILVRKRLSHQQNQYCQIARRALQYHGFAGSDGSNDGAPNGAVVADIFFLAEVCLSLWQMADYVCHTDHDATTRFDWRAARTIADRGLAKINALSVESAPPPTSSSSSSSSALKVKRGRRQKVGGKKPADAQTTKKKFSIKAGPTTTCDICRKKVPFGRLKDHQQRKACKQTLAALKFHGLHQATTTKSSLSDDSISHLAEMCRAFIIQADKWCQLDHEKARFFRWRTIRDIADRGSARLKATSLDSSDDDKFPTYAEEEEDGEEEYDGEDSGGDTKNQEENKEERVLGRIRPRAERDDDSRGSLTPPPTSRRRIGTEITSTEAPPRSHRKMKPILGAVKTAKSVHFEEDAIDDD
jgi:hypothetical protein